MGCRYGFWRDDNWCPEDNRKEYRSSDTEPEWSDPYKGRRLWLCATPWTTAELMEATHHRRTGTSHETTGTYKTNCVAQTTRQGRDSSGCSPVDDGRTAREGVSVLSNSNPWIGFQLGVFSYATGTSLSISPFGNRAVWCRMVEYSVFYIRCGQE